MELSLANIDRASEYPDRPMALFFPCNPEMQIKENQLDLHTCGPVLMVMHDGFEFVMQWFSRVMPGLCNDWEGFDTYPELLGAVREETKQYPELNIRENEGWLAADSSWW